MLIRSLCRLLSFCNSLGGLGAWPPWTRHSFDSFDSFDSFGVEIPGGGPFSIGMSLLRGKMGAGWGARMGTSGPRIAGSHAKNGCDR